MPQESETIHRMFRRRRIEAGLTQSELARQVGCKQSAISMFESGRVDVLSRDKLASIAERLGIDPDMLPAPELPAATVPRSPRRLYYCPVDECPSNIPYTVRKSVFSPDVSAHRRKSGRTGALSLVRRTARIPVPEPGLRGAGIGKEQFLPAVRNALRHYGPGRGTISRRGGGMGRGPPPPDPGIA